MRQPVPSLQNQTAAGVATSCTSVARLVDTNVLVYRFDPRDPVKQGRATSLLEAGLLDRSLRLAHQSIVEFVAVVTRPLKSLGGRALMSAPRLIMVDEVSQGLAPVVVQEVYRQLKRLSAQGMTVLMVEQNARLAFELATQVYVMEQGCVVAHGPTETVAQSVHVRNAYLGLDAT